jgi:DNA-directed RNA polymerase specialized sigma24 family protein
VDPMSSFVRLLAELAADSPSAAEAVVRQNYSRLVGVVRGRIGGKFRAKVDAESIANSAMKSFFRQYTGDRLALTDWQDLWNLLARIALNKLSNRLRLYRRQSRDVGREFACDGTEAARLTDGPEAEAVLSDLLDTLRAGATAEESTVLDLSLLGYPVAEIAAEVGVSDRTVQRVRKAFQRKLEGLTADDE